MRITGIITRTILYLTLKIHVCVLLCKLHKMYVWESLIILSHFIEYLCVQVYVCRLSMIWEACAL